jgi:hypothetical protein
MNLRYPPIAVSTFPADFACTTKINLSDLKTLNVFSFSQKFFPPRTFPSHIPTQSVFFFCFKPVFSLMKWFLSTPLHIANIKTRNITVFSHHNANKQLIR